MRVLVQRVTSASVSVAGEVVGEITPAGQGLLALVGVTHTDTPAEAAAVARKIHGMRVLRSELSVADRPGAAILVVSQFTVYADVRKGRRPSWSAAAPGPIAEPLVAAVVDELRALGANVATGVFGADMQVELINDGPITLIIDS